MKNLSIVFILHKFGPHFLGGADIYTYEIAEQLLHSGARVNVICVEDLTDSISQSGQVRTVDDVYEGLPVHRLYFDWQRMPDPYHALYVINPAVERAIFTQLKKLKPDVVHVTADVSITAAAITAPKFLRLPIVLTLTGKWYICPATTLLRRDGSICPGRQDGLTCLECMFGQTKTYRASKMLPSWLRNKALYLTGRIPFILRRVAPVSFIQAIDRRNRVFTKLFDQVDYIISPSQCHKKVYSQSGLISVDRIAHSPHGHKLDHILTGQYKTESKRTRFGYIGNIVEAKGVETLAKSFTLLGPRTDASLTFYGSLDIAPRFAMHLQGLVKPDIDLAFHGSFERNELARILSNIDVLVVPSRCVENAPLTIAEAHAARTPVIGSDVCGVEEWIEHDVNGLLFKRDNPEDLAKQLLRCLEEPGLIARLRDEIPNVKSTAQEALELAHIYDRLVNRKHEY